MNILCFELLFFLINIEMETIEQKNFAVVIPCFRGEGVLRDLVDAICGLERGPVQVLLIWDGGSERCWAICDELSKTYEEVGAVRLSRNFGQHNATICGFGLLNNVDWVVTMDEDGQHRPDDIDTLFSAVDPFTDVVYGVYDKPKFDRSRRILSRGLQIALQAAIPELPSEYSSFRLINSSLARELTGFSNSYTFLDGYLTWCTNGYKSVVVCHEKSGESKSSYSKRALVVHALNIFITFSILPLRLISLLGFGASILGFVLGLKAYLQKMWYPESILPGYTSVLIMASIGFGSVLFALGVISEYLYRVNEKTSGRPKYRVRS